MMDIREYLRQEREAREALETQRRQALQERKLPVYLRSIRFGAAIGYQFHLGAHFLAESREFYAEMSLGEFEAMDHAAQLQAKFDGQGFIAEHQGETWFFPTKADYQAYLRYEDRRQATVGLIVMIKMGMIA